jgi:lipid-A-disaccharide synthase-like uncharacterized protein
VILGLSFWIMTATSKSAPATPDAAQLEVLVANRKLKVEQRPSGNEPGRFEYRFRNWPEQGAEWIDEASFQTVIANNADLSDRPWLLKLCNVSSYPNLAWVGIGLGGQIVFAGRMLVQWLASEKSRKPVIPPIFWYMSLGGGLCLTAYFLWRHDLVGVLGQAMGLVVYVRNIRLLTIHKARLD